MLISYSRPFELEYAEATGPLSLKILYNPLMNLTIIYGP